MADEPSESLGNGNTGVCMLLPAWCFICDLCMPMHCFPLLVDALQLLTNCLGCPTPSCCYTHGCCHLCHCCPRSNLCRPYCAGGPGGENSTPHGTLSRHLTATCVLHHGIGAADLCLPRLLNCECPLRLVKQEDLCLQLQSGGRFVSGAPRKSTQRWVWR